MRRTYAQYEMEATTLAKEILCKVRNHTDYKCYPRMIKCEKFYRTFWKVQSKLKFSKRRMPPKNGKVIPVLIAAPIIPHRFREEGFDETCLSKVPMFFLGPIRIDSW